ncbi:MAG: ROK family protein [Bacteroidetes bacterium]|nr:ROK family protein [Bacteroidota bacterium]
MIGGHLKHEIISTFYFEKTLSIVELSSRLEKSVPHVTKAVNELIEAGLIEESGHAPSSGGRKPLMYSLKRSTLYIVAVAMDQLYFKITIIDILNNPVIPIESHELKLLNNAEALGELVAIINDCIKRSGIDKKKIIGAGIGTPGFTNNRLGINYSYLQPPEDESLLSYLERELEIPVRLDNDSSLIALAELKFGMAKGKEEVMVINIGWGIGLGMIVNGVLFRGYTGYAGELSHIPISESDILCDCGKRGCLETEGTLKVVTDKAMKGIKQGNISGLKYDDSPEKMSEAIMTAANKGDQYAIELLSDMGYKIGKAIAILIHIVNPELVVLSGRGSVVGKILLAPIQQALNKYCIPRLSEHTDVKVSTIGRKAELIGAAALVMENFGKPSSARKDKIKEQAI